LIVITILALWGRQFWRQAGFLAGAGGLVPKSRLERTTAASIGGPTMELQKPSAIRITYQNF
jgi:hypothetical protein